MKIRAAKKKQNKKVKAAKARAKHAREQRKAAAGNQGDDGDDAMADADAEVNAADEDVAIALIDPDFVFLRPLDLWVLLGERRGDRWDDRASVLELRGRPRAHYNGLGGKWLDFHRSAICGEGSPCSTRRPAGNAKDTRRVP